MKKRIRKALAAAAGCTAFLWTANAAAFTAGFIRFSPSDLKCFITEVHAAEVPLGIKVDPSDIQCCKRYFVVRNDKKCKPTLGNEDYGLLVEVLDIYFINDCGIETALLVDEYIPTHHRIESFDSRVFYFYYTFEVC